MCILHFQLIDLDLWNVFHPDVTSCLLSRGKTRYATLGMRLWCKYIRNYLLVYQLTSHFLSYLRNYKEFEGEISDLQLEKYGLSFETKKYTTSGWVRGDENVIGIRAFKYLHDLHKGLWSEVPPQRIWNSHIISDYFTFLNECISEVSDWNHSLNCTVIQNCRWRYVHHHLCNRIRIRAHHLISRGGGIFGSKNKTKKKTKQNRIK